MRLPGVHQSDRARLQKQTLHHQTATRCSVSEGEASIPINSRKLQLLTSAINYNYTINYNYMAAEPYFRTEVELAQGYLGHFN